MLPLHALTAIVPVTPAGSSAHRQAGSASFLDALMPGQRLRGTVHARLSGTEGEFVMAFDTSDGRGGRSPGAGAKGSDRQLLHVKLPMNARPGDVLDMVFISREPRPTFMLAAHAPGTDPSPLSLIGRFISNLLGRSVLQATPAATATLPLLPSPPADGAQLARNLADALGRSGLFYESHLAQWLSGTRTLAELALEPQSRLALFSRFRSFPSQPEPLLPAPPQQGGAVPHPAAESHGDQRAVHHPVHPEAQGLVRQQLEIFEMRQVAWQGFAWPGQFVEWEVAEDKPHTPAEADRPATWKSRLKLTLPNLGHVCASFCLDPCGMDVRVTTADPVTAFMLRSGTAPLTEALESAGIRLLGMKVDLEDPGVEGMKG